MADSKKIAGEEYISLVNVEGVLIHERADALRVNSERDVIEARYGYAIRKLRRAGAKTVLDMACGLGYGTCLLDRAGLAVEGVERDPDALAVARARFPWLTFHEADVLPFEHAPVDGIVACEFIEHIVNAKPFLSRMNRLLKPGGILVMTTPNRRYTSGKNPYHVHEYTVEELRSLLPRVAVRVFATKLFKPARFWIRLLGEESYARVNYCLSRSFPFHQLPRYAHTFALTATKEDLCAAGEVIEARKMIVLK
ncbi:MAG: class I SAM-dependent methyltransferase [bacterium]|nr:class I SAM-dependent methyltransferase [bacterium]